MSLFEIAKLLNHTLSTHLVFVKSYTKEMGQLLIETDEGALVSSGEALHLLPLIEILRTAKDVSSPLSFWDQWLHFLEGQSPTMPQNLILKPDVTYRLLKLDALSKSLQEEIQTTFLPLLESQVLLSTSQSTLWLIKSDSSILETIRAFSETLSIEYEGSIGITLSNSFSGELAERALPTTYNVILALENLQADEDAHAPIIFEDHMAALLLHEWDSKEMSPVERLIRENSHLEHLDEETHKTIETLFKMNLNLTDTAKALFIHRNTLIYRLDKIEKSLGYDLRHFEDAFALKLMLSLKK